MRGAVIVEAVRTLVGKGKGKVGGALSGVRPVDLLATPLRALIERTGIDPAIVDDVIGGAVDQVGEQAMNVTRSAVLAGAYDVVIACGVESMSRVPMWSHVPLGKDPFGPGVAARYPDGLVAQGISAEKIAAKWDLSRQELDDFALSSHLEAARATEEGPSRASCWPGRRSSASRSRRSTWTAARCPSGTPSAAVAPG